MAVCGCDVEATGVVALIDDVHFLWIMAAAAARVQPGLLTSHKWLGGSSSLPGKPLLQIKLDSSIRCKNREYTGRATFARREDWRGWPAAISASSLTNGVEGHADIGARGLLQPLSHQGVNRAKCIYGI
ncbi:hypothetical protein QQF64_023190 [Cirrhinus molitorella]|uniref:Uncharacterized protein n=1 Tax=Cirrhinus molitorella TaxID=172907 RepID=A0ABR3L834_9TELE